MPSSILLPRRFIAFISIPWVDKVIAFIAVSPFLYQYYRQFNHGTLGLQRAMIAINVLVHVSTMLARRAPLRVTPEPWLWLLTFASTFWMLLVSAFLRPGVPVIPLWAANFLSLLSFVVMIYARLSLGRSIGLVPAQRGTVTHGAYRYVRHPLYTAIFLAYLAFFLRNVSTLNAVFTGFGMLLFVIKSLVEENFLRGDAEYEKYLRQVPWRWLPRVL